MKIQQTKVTKLLQTELDRLDPISVILEDIGPRQGKIIIECYGESWSAYWGGMGDQTIAEFFISCDEHYLARKLSSIRSNMTDYEKVTEMLQAAGHDITICDHSDAAYFHHALASVFGDEWFRDLPDRPNPDYQYLCRIILAVQEGIKLSLQQEKAEIGCLSKS